jgi:hypothetical protein
MLRRLKHGVTVLALYAMALHVLLVAFAPVITGTAASPNPFSVICHSGVTDSASSSGTSDRSPALIPGTACEHCNLCSAAAPPPAPDVALDIQFAPSRVLHIFRPADMPAPGGIAFEPKLARGPPPVA